MKRKKRNSSNKRQLSTAKREIITSRREVAVAQYHHSGPIPDPMTLERYNNLVPGAAERIIMMAEMQSDHRRSMEAQVIRSGTRNSLLGIICGFLIALATLASGIIITLNGYEVGGTIIGGTGIATLAGVFVYGTQSARKEREEKEAR